MREKDAQDVGSTPTTSTILNREGEVPFCYMRGVAWGAVRTPLSVRFFTSRMIPKLCPLKK